MRVKGTHVTRTRRKKYIKLAKGYRGQRKINFKVAKQQVLKSYLYSYRDRKNRKRDFRKLWIARINAGTRLYGLSYSKFMNGLKKANVEIDRKNLSELALSNDDNFRILVETSKQALTNDGFQNKENKLTLESSFINENENVKDNSNDSKETVSSKPTAKSTVAEIKNYLKDNNIDFSLTAKKNELLDLIK